MTHHPPSILLIFLVSQFLLFFPLFFLSLFFFSFLFSSSLFFSNAQICRILFFRNINSIQQNSWRAAEMLWFKLIWQSLQSTSLITVTGKYTSITYLPSVLLSHLRIYIALISLSFLLSFFLSFTLSLFIYLFIYLFLDYQRMPPTILFWKTLSTQLSIALASTYVTLRIRKRVPLLLFVFCKLRSYCHTVMY